MPSWKCRTRGYIYTESEPPGAVPFRKVPDTRRCPVCNAGKDAFVELAGSVRKQSDTPPTTIDIETDPVRFYQDTGRTENDYGRTLRMIRSS